MPWPSAQPVEALTKSTWCNSWGPRQIRTQRRPRLLVARITLLPTATALVVPMAWTAFSRSMRPSARVVVGAVGPPAGELGVGSAVVVGGGVDDAGAGAAAGWTVAWAVQPVAATAAASKTAAIIRTDRMAAPPRSSRDPCGPSVAGWLGPVTAQRRASIAATAKRTRAGRDRRSELARLWSVHGLPILQPRLRLLLHLDRGWPLVPGPAGRGRRPRRLPGGLGQRPDAVRQPGRRRQVHGQGVAGERPRQGPPGRLGDRGAGAVEPLGRPRRWTALGRLHLPQHGLGLGLRLRLHHGRPRVHHAGQGRRPPRLAGRRYPVRPTVIAG